MMRELRFAVRGLRRSPGFTAVTLATLALGLAGTVTMFAAVNAAFFRPLPYPDEATLVRAYEAGTGKPTIAVPFPVGAAWVRDNRTFTGLALYAWGSEINVSDGRSATRAGFAEVTSRFFEVMRIGPARGRLFTADETRPGGAGAVLISDRLWRQLLGGRPDAIGQTTLIDGAPVPVVGVMPPGFHFPDATDVWGALERYPPASLGSSTAHNFSVIGRLRPGVSPAGATRDLTAVNRTIEATDPEMAKEHLDASVVPLRADLLGPQAGVVLIGLGAVLTVLLIACVNVVNLMLARSVAVEAQTGIRVALGASRLAIARGVVAEGLVLAAGGGAAGALLGLAGTRLVSTMTPDTVTQGQPLGVDWRVGALTIAATTLAGVLCALLPSLRSARVDARQALAGGSRTIASSPRRLMNALVGVEVALAFVLLFAAGLLARTDAALERVDPGFRTEGVTLMNVSIGGLPSSPYGSPNARRRCFARLDEAVSGIAGVARVGLAETLPLGFSANGQFEVLGRGLVPRTMRIDYRLVGGDYFQALDIPLRRGRFLNRTDDADHPRVAVVNETLARRVFGQQNPIGQQIRMPGMDGGDDRYADVVGVVGDIHHDGPSQPPLAEAYFPYLQRPWRTYSMSLVVTGTAPEPTLVNAMRARLGALDPTVPPVFSTLAERMATVLEPSRFRARLLGVLAGLALVLAAVGIFGVVSYGVACRRQEIGVRMALGAAPGRITALVLRSGLGPVVAGALAGSLAALFLARTLATYLFQVAPRDTLTLAATGLTLVLVGLAANWWPAHLAARLDPMRTLRE
jgi:putative ABC transport system permease protein